ncbi:7660_t:CDS:2, partial [Diversispora eburnea]
DCVIKISKFPEEKDPEAKCPICNGVHIHRGIWGDWSCLEPRSPTHPNKNRLYQYAIEYGVDPEKFSVITEAEKKRNEDTRKYHKFLTDRDRLIGEELLHHGIIKSELSTA